MSKVTQTNGNSSNKIRGCRITIRNSNNVVVDQFVVPSKFGGVNYCKKHPTGDYGKRFYEALRIADQNSSEQPKV